MTDEKTDLVPRRVEEGGLIESEYIHYERDGIITCGAPLDSSEYVDVSEFLSLVMLHSEVGLCKPCYIVFNKSFRSVDGLAFYHYLDPLADHKKYLCGLDVPMVPFEQAAESCALCEYEFIVVRGRKIKELPK